jgi:hypothetical protein
VATLGAPGITNGGYEMKSWEIRLGLVLVLLSSLTFLIYHLIFDQDYYMFMYFLGDLAFVFINVLLVTLIIQSLLERRQKLALIGMMSTVIGAFYSELGRPLILVLTNDGTNHPNFGTDLKVHANWTGKDYDLAVEKIAEKDLDLKLNANDLLNLKKLLTEKRSFLLGMMENPNLMEHERFTELLLALFHLQEELMNRKDVLSLPPTDIKHLNKDAERAYSLIIREWIFHVRHLQVNYPYLFSLAVRTNPFDPGVDSVVRA